MERTPPPLKQPVKSKFAVSTDDSSEGQSAHDFNNSDSTMDVNMNMDSNMIQEQSKKSDTFTAMLLKESEQLLSPTASPSQRAESHKTPPLPHPSATTATPPSRPSAMHVWGEDTNLDQWPRRQPTGPSHETLNTFVNVHNRGAFAAIGNYAALKDMTNMAGSDSNSYTEEIPADNEPDSSTVMAYVNSDATMQVDTDMDELLNDLSIICTSTETYHQVLGEISHMDRGGNSSQNSASTNPEILNEDPSQSSPEIKPISSDGAFEEVVFIMGCQGDGKSTVANFMLGRKEFDCGIDITGEGMTKSVQFATVKRRRIVDTPALLDFVGDASRHEEKQKRLQAICSEILNHRQENGVKPEVKLCFVISVAGSETQPHHLSAFCSLVNALRERTGKNPEISIIFNKCTFKQVVVIKETKKAHSLGKWSKRLAAILSPLALFNAVTNIAFIPYIENMKRCDALYKASVQLAREYVKQVEPLCCTSIINSPRSSRQQGGSSVGMELLTRQVPSVESEQQEYADFEEHISVCKNTIKQKAMRRKRQDLTLIRVVNNAHLGMDNVETTAEVKSFTTDIMASNPNIPRSNIPTQIRMTCVSNRKTTLPSLLFDAL